MRSHLAPPVDASAGAASATGVPSATAVATATRSRFRPWGAGVAGRESMAFLLGSAGPEARRCALGDLSRTTLRILCDYRQVTLQLCGINHGIDCNPHVG